MTVRSSKKAWHKSAFQKIDECLSVRGYSKEKIAGLYYWLWSYSETLYFYVKHGNYGVNTIYIDAKLIELKKLLGTVDGILVSATGTSPNHKFELFQVARIRADGKNQHDGWGFRFKDEISCSSFLEICEAYDVGGLTLAKS